MRVAGELAEARKATDTNPTGPQIESGNYRKGEVRLHGLRIKLENPKGSTRRSKPGEKPAWSRTMVHDYGYIPGVEGADGDAVDVFIGPHLESELAVVVDQVGADGSFDEHKILLGFRAEDEAVAGYLAHYPKGWKVGKTTSLTIDQFKQWLRDGKTKKPVAGRVVVLMKADVRAPGSRGGRWYRTPKGKIKYGIPPSGAKPFHGAVSRQQNVRQLDRDSGLFAGRVIRGPADSAGIFREVTDLDRERLWLVHMNEAARPVAVECVSQGSLFQSIANPREVFKNATALGTRSVALVHNHPGGESQPSRNDITVTDRLSLVGASMGIPLAHHVVVSLDGFTQVSVEHEEDEQGPPTPWGQVPRGRRQLTEIEGRIERVDTPAAWSDILEKKMHSITDVADLGRRLLDPPDRTLLALMIDRKSRVTGVFPLASDAIPRRTVADLMTLSVATGSAGVVLVAGRNGDQWQKDVEKLHVTARAYLRGHVPDTPDNDFAEINLADTVSVGTGSSFRSMRIHETVQWDRKR